MSSSKDELYKLLLETSPFGVLFFVYGVCVDANPEAQKILGCNRKTLVGCSLDEFDVDESIGLAAFKECLDSALKSGESRKRWFLSGEKDSDALYMDIRSVSDGSQKEIVVTLYSTEELAGLSSDGASSQQTETAIDVQPTGIKPAGDRIEPGMSFPRAAPGVASNEGEGFNTTREKILHKLRGSSDFHAGTMSTPEQNGIREKEHAEFSYQAVADSIPEKLPEYIPAGVDEVVDEERRITRRFYRDALTGLPNREALLDRVRNYLSEETDQPVCAALMLIDLDHFKDINDSWGHRVGDQVLIKVGRMLSQLVSDQTMLARMSGDEFLFFIPSLGEGLTEAAYRAREIANSVRELVTTPVFFEGNEFILTASMGISLINDCAISPERALQYADTAMYEAKRKGRNGFAFFDPGIRTKAQQQIGLNTRLRKAVDNQEFALYIQPQVSTTDGRLVGGEALLRWVNADRVMNMPAEFIPPLEASGLIVDVGYWVIRTACESLRSFIDAGLWRNEMKLGINISPRQFKDPQLLEVIKHSISSYGIEPSYLNFEITENLMVEDVENTIKIMESIKALGAQFSIDDFGIGYSSMIYLKRLPFDWLKIDREFIHNVHSDSDSRGIVEAILTVSRQYGLQVTAEGVEEQGSLDVLRSIGCEAYQGALYSMPVPVDQFRNMLAA